MSTVQFKRGLKATIPSSANAGEPVYALNTNELFIGNGSGVPLTPVTTLVEQSLINGNLKVNGSELNVYTLGSPVLGIQTITSDTTLTNTGAFVRADTLSNDIVITLPDATTCPGVKFTTKRINDSIHTLSIVCAVTGQTIDEKLIIQIAYKNTCVSIVSDGSNYMIVD